MNTTLEEIEGHAQKLPPEERERLAQKLFGSVHNQDLNETDMAWLEVAERRAEAYQNGTDPGVPEDEFYARIERDLGWK